MTPDLAEAIVYTWRRFSRHAAECEPCSPLAAFVRSQPFQPPYQLVSACCEAGRDLVERWLHARAVFVERYRDLIRAI